VIALIIIIPTLVAAFPVEQVAYSANSAGPVP
jgi:hypothetical protein